MVSRGSFILAGGSSFHLITGSNLHPPPQPPPLPPPSPPLSLLPITHPYPFPPHLLFLILLFLFVLIHLCLSHQILSSRSPSLALLVPLSSPHLSPLCLLLCLHLPPPHATPFFHPTRSLPLITMSPVWYCELEVARRTARDSLGRCGAMTSCQHASHSIK